MLFHPCRNRVDDLGTLLRSEDIVVDGASTQKKSSSSGISSARAQTSPSFAGHCSV